MFDALLTTALVGASCISTLVSAVPLPASENAATATSGNNPLSLPLFSGSPNIDIPSPQLTDIQVQARGTLPNGPLPPSIGPQGIINLQTIASNELFEAHYFTQLKANITNNVPGYELGANRQQAIDAITAIQAQEELHALFANEALAHFGFQPIQPCKYETPVTDFASAIELASNFTDVVLGTLQDIQVKFATENDDDLIPGIASVIGQEGEQNGYFRILQNKIPSELPFLTRSTREFALSVLNQLFVVPGSCPNANTIDLHVFEPLMLATTNIQPKDQDLKFSFMTTDSTTMNYDSMRLVYINQQNVPVAKTLENVHVDVNTVTFTAAFPYSEFLMNGLTIAAVTKGKGPFASAEDVTKDTMFGPAVILIN